MKKENSHEVPALLKLEGDGLVLSQQQLGWPGI